MQALNFMGFAVLSRKAYEAVKQSVKDLHNLECAYEQLVESSERQKKSQNSTLENALIDRDVARQQVNTLQRLLNTEKAVNEELKKKLQDARDEANLLRAELRKILAEVETLRVFAGGGWTETSVAEQSSSSSEGKEADTRESAPTEQKEVTPTKDSQESTNS